MESYLSKSFGFLLTHRVASCNSHTSDGSSGGDSCGSFFLRSIRTLRNRDGSRPIHTHAMATAAGGPAFEIDSHTPDGDGGGSSICQELSAPIVSQTMRWRMSVSNRDYPQLTTFECLWGLLLLFLVFVEEGSAFSAIQLSPRRPMPLLFVNNYIITCYNGNLSRRTSHLRMINGDKANDDGDGISVGIDLGTTNSAIAVLSSSGKLDGTSCSSNSTVPIIVPVPHSGRTMPSAVAFDCDSSNSNGHQVWVGRPAQERPFVYRNVKRILGTGGKLPSDICETVPFVQPNPSGKTYKKDSLQNQLHDAKEHPTMLWNVTAAADKDSDSLFLHPELISSHILQTLKAAAEAETGQKVARAVIGVPAYFHDAQREATIAAATLAGIPKVKLLREPEAAALAYGIGKEQVGEGDRDELVLVFDLGGGTFDVSMLAVGGGVAEIISTSGNARLGGSVFDARLAQHLLRILADSSSIDERNDGSTKKWSETAKTAVVLAAEAIRIHLSNNRWANLALPRSEEMWTMRVAGQPQSVLLPKDYDFDNNTENKNTGTKGNIISTNATHILLQLTRREMERLCQEELQALLRPVREVAIMSGALLPGDSSPSIVEATLEMEEEYNIVLQQSDDNDTFDDFYQDDEDGSSDDGSSDDDDGSSDDNTLKRDGTTHQLMRGDGTTRQQQQQQMESDLLLEIDLMKQTKKEQQRGRRRARNVAKQERKFRQERRKLETTAGAKSRSNKNNNPGAAATLANVKDTNTKVRLGITGRPISRIVLVGGATRMPAIGRLLASLTGVTPQKTVNPDEAVALGCAVHAGILDGQESMGTVLNPMQAAILRAVAKQQGLGAGVEQDFDSEFDEVEYF